MRYIPAVLLSCMILFSSLPVLCDNYMPKSNSEDIPVPKDLETKIDKAISIMEIIKKDVRELEKKEIVDKNGNLNISDSPDKRWSENVNSNLDTMMRLMEIVKDDVSEIKKMDERKEDKRSQEAIN